MRTTLVYMLAVVVVAVGFGLLFSVLNRQFRGRTVARGVMTVPRGLPGMCRRSSSSSGCSTRTSG